MYDYIKGIIVQKHQNTPKGNFVTLECSNIGYLIETNHRTLGALPDLQKECKIFTSLTHREDFMGLCGFSSKEDRDIFNILQSVSGIGVKAALVLLDEFSGCELIAAVIKEDAKALSRAKGVGQKMAQKIILELKDKLINWQEKMPVDLSDVSAENIDTADVSDAQAVLVSLGYTIDEIKPAIKFAVAKAGKNINSEEILKQALTYLAQ